jgi:hypothetical protein
MYGKHFNQERSISIPIKKNLFSNMKENNIESEYSLKQNFFDPSKCSPPNDFMNKLKKRMSIYNNIDIYSEMKLNNRASE